MGIKSNFSELVGGTPLFELCALAARYSLDVRLLAKLEYLNPAGSTKDRAALAMIDDAEQRGLLKSGATIVEPTSGNTGIGLAAVAAGRGYRVILTMPDTMSVERRRLLTAYGAQLVLTPGSEGMSGAIEKAREISQEIEGSFWPDQFSNPANPRVHFQTTGPEIWEDAGGDIDIFVAGVGSGGTISGAGGFLKSKKPDIKVVAVEPALSPVLSGGSAGAHGIQGIGAGFIPEALDTSSYGEIMAITDEEARCAAAEVARTEGLLVGISSGAALASGIRLAAQPENREKTIVLILPDSGDRYLSTGAYD